MKKILVSFILFVTIILFSGEVTAQWKIIFKSSNYNITVPVKVLTDSYGDIYVYGYAASSDSAYSRDLILIKYSSAGEHLWTKTYNGPYNSEEAPADIVLDKSENIIITAASIGYQTNYDYITLKYSPSGSLLWESRFDDSTHHFDKPRKILVDDSDNVYVSGVNILYYNEIEVVRLGVVKYSPDGIQRWNKYFINEGHQNRFPVFAVMNPATGESYHTGCTFGMNSRGLVKKLDRNGNLIWSKIFIGSGSSIDIISSAELSNSGNLYAGGYSIFYPGYGTFFRLRITKFNSQTGDTVWSRIFNQPGYGDERGGTIVLDNSGNAYLSGELQNNSYGRFIAGCIDDSGNTLWKATTGNWLGLNYHTYITGLLDNIRNSYYIFARTIPYSNYEYSVFKYNINGQFIGFKSYNFDYKRNCYLTDAYIDINGNLIMAGYIDDQNKKIGIIKESNNIVGINNINEIVPESFVLYQNFPNPFNSTTKISYSLPKPSDIKLAVYDILGKEITVLINEYKSPGTYETFFDASGLSGGIYFYKLYAGDFTETKKMIFAK